MLNLLEPFIYELTADQNHWFSLLMFFCWSNAIESHPSTWSDSLQIIGFKSTSTKICWYQFIFVIRKSIPKTYHWMGVNINLNFPYEYYYYWRPKIVWGKTHFWTHRLCFFDPLFLVSFESQRGSEDYWLVIWWIVIEGLIYFSAIWSSSSTWFKWQ